MEGHTPVLKTEVLQVFRDVCGTVWDGTFGGGGHSEALLKQNPSLYVVATDTDPEAAERSPLTVFCWIWAFLRFNLKHQSAGFHFATKVRSICG